MSQEIDIRQTLSYSGVWNTNKGPQQKIRFRVADESYICFSAVYDEWMDEEDPDYEVYRNILVKFNRDESCKLFAWNALITYEDHSNGFQIKNFNCKPSVDEKFPNEKAIGVSVRDAMKFTIKFIIGAQKDVAKEKEMGDEMVSVSKAWFDAVKKRITTDVRLIGKDGTVDTKMELLMAMSPTFKAMFNTKTSKEYKEKAVKLRDFSKATLEAFVKFLEKYELHDGNNNACDLLLLANKYHVPLLKSRAEQFLLNNVTTGNAREVHKVFAMVSPNLLEELFVKTVAKK